MQKIFKNIITLSGKPGCGKTTVADLLSKKLGYEILSSGDGMREIAKKYDMDITTFITEFMPRHPDIDIEFDNNFIEECKKRDNLIVPTRILSQLLEKNNIENFKVFLFANKKTRIERLKKRELYTKKEAENEINKRENAEREKFIRLYKIDINNFFVYNLLVYTHFTEKNIGKIKLKIKYGNSFVVKYIKTKNTLPSTLVKIIINEYKEYVRRTKK